MAPNNAILTVNGHVGTIETFEDTIFIEARSTWREIIVMLGVVVAMETVVADNLVQHYCLAGEPALHSRLGGGGGTQERVKPVSGNGLTLLFLFFLFSLWRAVVMRGALAVSNTSSKCTACPAEGGSWKSGGRETGP